MTDLYWHCLQCGAHESVAASTPEYKLGDWEKCIDCGGQCYVMTLKLGAAYEQGLALGLSRDEAWSRAKTLTSLKEQLAKAMAERKTSECPTHDKTRRCLCRCHGKARMKHTVACCNPCKTCGFREVQYP